MKVITIGRGQDNDYVINSPKVSRYNTQIIKSDDGAFSIVDMGSVNGTYVNGIRISGEQKLSAKDTVKVADITIDWRILFGEGGHIAASTDHKKNNWVLILVLSTVSLTLIVGMVYLMFLFMRHKIDDAKRIDNLEELNEELKSNSEWDSATLNLFQKELEIAKGKTTEEQERVSQMKQQAREIEETAKLKITEAEALNKKLEDEIKAVKANMNREVTARDESLAESEKKKEALEEELKKEQQRLRDMKDEYEFIMNNLEVYAALENAPHKEICDQLKYDYTDRDPKEVLFEKINIKEERDIIMAVAKRIQSTLEK